jgi:DNA primase
VTGFIGRARDARIAGAPKYLNTPRTCLFDKSRLLFGLYEARTALAAGARPVIVEGPFDAIAVTAAGQERFAGVGTCGTAVTAQHIAALAQGTDLRAVGPSSDSTRTSPGNEPLSALNTCSVPSRTSWTPLTSNTAKTRRTSSPAKG